MTGSFWLQAAQGNSRCYFLYGFRRTHVFFLILQGRTPGLIQHMLTVLVFWSWVLLQPRLPTSSRSLGLFPALAFCFMGPWTCLDLLPTAPLPPVQKHDAQHKFYSTRGHAPNSSPMGEWHATSKPRVMILLATKSGKTTLWTNTDQE